MKPAEFKLNLDPKQQKFLAPFLAILLALLGFLGGTQYQKSVVPVLPATPTLPTTASVSRVVDGDTFELDTGQAVRLYGISCPDYNEPFYEEAANFTEQFIEDRTVTLEYESGYESDKFDRLLVYAIVDDQNLNVELARNGLAEVVIYEKRRKLIYEDELLEVQAYAKENKLGIWSTKSE